MCWADPVVSDAWEPGHKILEIECLSENGDGVRLSELVGLSDNR